MFSSKLCCVSGRVVEQSCTGLIEKGGGSDSERSLSAKQRVWVDEPIKIAELHSPAVRSAPLVQKAGIAHTEELGGNESAFSTHPCNVSYILKHTFEH